MSERHFYDENGNYRGKSSDASPLETLIGNVVGGAIFILVVLAAAAAAIGALWQLLTEYRSYSLPYNVIAGYYYVIGQVGFSPFAGARWLYISVTAPGLTQYKNLNLLIAIAAGCVTVVIPYAAAYLAMNRFRLRRYIPSVLLVPALIAATWALLKTAFLWVFA